MLVRNSALRTVVHGALITRRRCTNLVICQKIGQNLVRFSIFWKLLKPFPVSPWRWHCFTMNSSAFVTCPIAKTCGITNFSFAFTIWFSVFGSDNSSNGFLILDHELTPFCDKGTSFFWCFLWPGLESCFGVLNGLFWVKTWFHNATLWMYIFSGLKSVESCGFE